MTTQVNTIYENILYDVPAPGVAKITLNRPDALNAFTPTMVREITKALQVAKDAAEVRAVIITGAGRAFCAGQDLKATPEAVNDVSNLLKTTYRPMLETLGTLGKPTLAMVNGVAAGAGMSLSIACDFRVASEKAKFVTAFAKIALVPDSGMIYNLPRLVGLGRAQELISLNRDLTAKEALDWGLVTRVAAPEELEATTMQIATQLATSATYAFSLTRQMLHQSFELDLDRVLKLEETNQGLAGTSADFKEGVAAFEAKRLPNFKGK